MNKEYEQKDSNNDHEKGITIIVNGRKKTLSTEELPLRDRLSFEQLVALAFENPSSGKNIVFTTTYRGGDDNAEGTLTEGDSIKVKNEMIFNVTVTDKS